MKSSRPGMPTRERLERMSIPEPMSGCWLWLAATWNGYGRIRMGNQGSAKAHRISYETYVGSIPEGLVIDHLCRNTMCINPDHLEPVTNDENLKRSPLYYGHQTHCKNGHEYSAATVRMRTRPSRPQYIERECVPCLDERARQQRERRDQLTPGDPRHGLRGYKDHGCRCETCKVAGALRWQEYRARKAAVAS